MKKTQIFVLLLILTVAISALSSRKADIQAASRGKVVADKSSGLFDIKLDEASIFNLIMGSSAAEDIAGRVCILDENDEPTGEYIRMVPRSFPNWFVFGCEDGTIITYKIVEKGNGEKQAIVKVGRKPK